MVRDRSSIFDRVLLDAASRRWAQVARKVDHTSLPILRGQVARARQIKAVLDQFLHRAEDRIHPPFAGSTKFPKPADAEWSWRPQLWRGPLPTPGLSPVRNKARLGDEITLFYDCPKAELVLRQLRNLAEADLAPYGLRLEVFQFEGAFLSLAVDLPAAACETLSETHLIRLDAFIEVEQPIDIFARLNIQQGPNARQVLCKLPLARSRMQVEFDLAYADMSEQRVEKLWLDLIFEKPDMNQITVRDLTMVRRPRAAF